MIRIHFLSKRDYRSHCLTFPVRVFTRQLKRDGIESAIFNRDDHPRLSQCDVLLVLNDYYGIRHLSQQPDTVRAFLEQQHGKVGALIWADNTDGTGTMFEAAFDVVDLYLKKQLLKDRTRYQRAYHEREYHLDYYYQHYGDELAQIGNKSGLHQRPLTEQDIAKLRLSWNLGLGDYVLTWGRFKKPRLYWPWPRYPGALRRADVCERPIDMSYRAGMDYSLPAARFHRQQVQKWVVQAAAEQPNRDIRFGQTLPRAQYLNEMAMSRIVLSPFGWGELCWRDFEAILRGAALMKPNMDHMETWPDYFHPHETYIPFAWDLSDFEANLRAMLRDPMRTQAIAHSAQQRLLDSYSTEGGKAFARRFKMLLDEALTLH